MTNIFKIMVFNIMERLKGNDLTKDQINVYRS